MRKPLAMISPLGYAVTMFYNNRGLNSGISNELGYLRTVTFDGAANKLTEVSFGSQVITNVFDPGNRRTARQYMNGTIASWIFIGSQRCPLTTAGGLRVPVILAVYAPTPNRVFYRPNFYALWSATQVPGSVRDFETGQAG